MKPWLSRCTTRPDPRHATSKSEPAQGRLPLDMSQNPWTLYARKAIRQHRQKQAELIQNYFADDEVPMSGTELVTSPNTSPSAPDGAVNVVLGRD